MYQCKKHNFLLMC